MVVYFNNKFLLKEEVKISPDDRGFLFADGVYEVIRSYNGILFKVEEHFKRLSRSLQEIQINIAGLEDLRSVAAKLLQDNNLQNCDAAVYIQITRGAAPREHAFPEEETLPTVYASAFPFELDQAKLKNGVKIILVPDIRWTRCDIKSVALLPNVLASQKAKESGVEEAVFVRDGVITEGAHSSFCAVFNGRLVTHPLNNHVLGGITRGVVLDLCKKLNIPCQESYIHEKDLNSASECMITGTIEEVMPVVQVNDHIVGDGKPGPIAIQLQQAFQKIVEK